MQSETQNEAPESRWLPFVKLAKLCKIRRHRSESHADVLHLFIQTWLQYLIFTQVHSEWSKLYGVLVLLSAVGLHLRLSGSTGACI